MINITGNIDLTVEKNEPEEVIIILKGYGDDEESLDALKEKIEIKNQEPSIDYVDDNFTYQDWLKRELSKKSNKSLYKLQDRLKEYELKDEDVTFDNLDEFFDEQRSYYTHNDIAAWDIIDEIQEYHSDGIDNIEAGLLFNVFKYLLRYPYKGDSTGDLEKSIKYIERIIDHIKL